MLTRRKVKTSWVQPEPLHEKQIKSVPTEIDGKTVSVCTVVDVPYSDIDKTLPSRISTSDVVSSGLVISGNTDFNLSDIADIELRSADGVSSLFKNAGLVDINGNIKFE